MWFITIIILFVITIDGAIGQQRQAGMMGQGVNSCAEFARDYRLSPQVAETLYFTWAQGYMSGLNIAQLALKRRMRDLNALSVSDQQIRLRQFCDERPLLTVYEATMRVFMELPELPP